ncbi:unnamed protein product [Durusdinium trenchii]|uniref:Adaptin ear-binding coat-associated protein 2 (NECAP endocytosis-associated protein 2) (NECAP-2) n=2 Tax=Durusdinium trenchii TaxID=1381693 RepID=A0ABP0QK28_9DINO
MADERDPDVEYVLLNKRDAKVYKVPPAASASGHKASDWQEAIWRGNLRIVARGTELSIRLLDSSSGNLFAQCVIPDGLYEHYVERVVDSSRYWVLKIVNGPRHAFIGFGFSERNDAFDFNACLADFKATFIDKVHEAKAAEAMPTKDLSLKEGETIKVSLPGKGARRREVKAGYPAGLLAPPPATSTSVQAPPSISPNEAASSDTAPLKVPAAVPAEDLDFADFQSAAATQS